MAYNFAILQAEKAILVPDKANVKIQQTRSKWKDKKVNSSGHLIIIQKQIFNLLFNLVLLKHYPKC